MGPTSATAWWTGSRVAIYEGALLAVLISRGGGYGADA